MELLTRRVCRSNSGSVDRLCLYPWLGDVDIVTGWGLSYLVASGSSSLIPLSETVYVPRHHLRNVQKVLGKSSRILSIRVTSSWE